MFNFFVDFSGKGKGVGVGVGGVGRCGQIGDMLYIEYINAFCFLCWKFHCLMVCKLINSNKQCWIQKFLKGSSKRLGWGMGAVLNPPSGSRQSCGGSLGGKVSQGLTKSDLYI